jgi:hypothetical protein
MKRGERGVTSYRRKEIPQTGRSAPPGPAWGIALLAFLAAGLLIALLSGTARAEAVITGVEVNQVIGVQKDSHTYFVAGKKTAVRVLLSEALPVDASQTWVTVRRDGREAFRLRPRRAGQAAGTIDFLCTSMEACGNWAAGDYTFDVTVNGSLTTTAPENGAYRFRTGASFRILAVPIKANYNGTIMTIPDDRWKRMWEFTRNVYPVADNGVKWIAYNREIDASASRYNLMAPGETGQLEVWKELKKLMPAVCKTSPRDPGCYELIVGFMPQGIPTGTGAIQGFMWPGAPVNVVAAGDEDAAATVAHEMAHVYGIGDTYSGGSLRCDVNPAPDGYPGTDWVTDQSFQGCTAGAPESTLTGPYGPVSGTGIPANQHPYEVSGRGPLPEMADFMGSGARQSRIWITPDTYDWLYRRLVLGQADTHSAVMGAAATPQRFLSFSGFLTRAGALTLEPWKSYADTAEVADTTGDLMVRALDGGDNVVASSSFTVSFLANSPPGRPLRTVDKAFFSGVIRFPDDTEKFEVIRNGAVLAEVEVSNNPPTVGNVTPASRVTLDGPYTITWDSNDPDGGTLTYTVEYNRDVTDPESRWMILADGIDTTSWEEDFSSFPGGTHAKIRVTADDGVLTATAESAEFTVPVEGPEVFIDDLPWGTTYRVGDEVLLSAEAYDPQDEWLDDGQLRWTSNIAGDLGTGSELIVENLPAGSHTITVTATNSSGLTATDSVNVVVEGPRGSGGGGCFIATAAYGSYLNPLVKILRAFRDTFLLKSAPGRAFVAWYYRTSPPIAEALSRSSVLRAGVRVMLLPLIVVAFLCLKVGIVATGLMILGCAGLVVGATMVGKRPAPTRPCSGD